MKINIQQNSSDQTKKSFFDKWTNNKNLGYEDIFDESSEITSWILKRNGWNSFHDLSNFLSPRKRVLDAGCGNGRISLLFSKLTNGNTVTGVDINPTFAQENLSNIPNLKIKFHDLLEPLDEKFDFIYSQEVLHHTSDPKKAFSNLVNALDTNGIIAVYVYKIKGPVREFTDEFIREKIRDLNYEEAIRLMKEVTQFGKELSSQTATVYTRGVSLLEIPEGEYTIQRLLYHFFFKCFWNGNLSESDNTAINFDWYSPQLASKYRLNEVLGWFESENLKVSHQFEDEYGITVHGVKLEAHDG